jgi:hypothetical protein
MYTEVRTLFLAVVADLYFNYSCLNNQGVSTAKLLIGSIIEFICWKWIVFHRPRLV